MSIVVCAKDLGLTEAYTEGSIRAIDAGSVTVAGVLLNMPGAEYALRELKKRPWISLVWQLAERGRCEVNTRLLEAEILECIRIYGRAPEVMLTDSERLSEYAFSVCAKYGIMTSPESCGIDTVLENTTGLGFEGFPSYYPAEAMRQAEQNGGVTMACLYPGFLDDIVMRDSLDEPRNIHRMADQRWLCSEECRLLATALKLVNIRDLITGRHDFMNYVNRQKQKGMFE